MHLKSIKFSAWSPIPHAPRSYVNHSLYVLKGVQDSKEAFSETPKYIPELLMAKMTRYTVGVSK